jgi:hypothetical protein
VPTVDDDARLHARHPDRSAKLVLGLPLMIAHHADAVAQRAPVAIEHAGDRRAPDRPSFFFFALWRRRPLGLGRKLSTRVGTPLGSALAIDTKKLPARRRRSASVAAGGGVRLERPPSPLPMQARSITTYRMIVAYVS